MEIRTMKGRGVKKVVHAGNEITYFVRQNHLWRVIDTPTEIKVDSYRPFIFLGTWTLDVNVHLALLIRLSASLSIRPPRIPSQDRNLANIVPTDNKPSSLAKQKKKRRCHSLSLCPPNSSRNYCSKRTVLSAQLMMKVRGKWNERGNHRQRHHRKKSLQKKTCCNHISNQFYVSITKYKLLHRTRLRNLLIVIHQK